MRWGPTASVVAIIATASLLEAGQAAAAVILTNKPCYQGSPLAREPVIFSGFGYTPGGLVDIRRDGLSVGSLPANARGAVVGLIGAPIIDPTRERRFSLVAIDRTNPALTATLTPLATIFEVKVRPVNGAPGRRRRIAARGFTSGARLYVHVRRGGRGRNLSLGKLGQPCGTKRIRKRIFRRRTSAGSYRVQFDTHRRYSATRLPRITFSVSIFRVFRRSAARAGMLAPLATAGALRERWERTF